MRQLSYAEALREAHAELLANDPAVFVFGQGLWSPWYVGSSMKDLDRDFGRERIIDSPVSENATTGAAIGAALAGMRPIVVHPRMDFMLLAVDPIVNQAANWSYMFAGRVPCPVVIRAIINRGGEQAAQHSQAVQAFFAHVPGMKVVMPATAHDAKGLLVASVYDGNPVMYIDDRWLYSETDDVPEGLYKTPIGSAAVRQTGSDVTVVATSYMVPQAMKAAAALKTRGVSVEVIDLRTLKPWDRETVFGSVARTGRLVVADAAWMTAGFAAEIVASVVAELFDDLKAAPVRVCLPDTPAPMSKALEDRYYRSADHIVTAAEQVMDRRDKLARPV